MRPPRPARELKTSDIAGNARAYTLLISCTATEQADASSDKRSHGENFEAAFMRQALPRPSTTLRA